MSHILIVEDDEMLGEMVELILDRAGMTHARARTGAMALEMLLHVKPDLILLDISMPGLSGLDVLQVVRRERRQTTPILMMTANQSAETVRDVMAMGGNGYVLKPFTPEALVERIRKALVVSNPTPRTAVSWT